MRFAFDDLTHTGPQALSAKEQDKSLLMNLTCGFSGVRLILVKDL
jgi:hypothetical protein